jgi:hypothetical protein
MQVPSSRDLGRIQFSPTQELEWAKRKGASMRDATTAPNNHPVSAFDMPAELVRGGSECSGSSAPDYALRLLSTATRLWN